MYEVSDKYEYSVPQRCSVFGKDLDNNRTKRGIA